MQAKPLPTPEPVVLEPLTHEGATIHVVWNGTVTVELFKGRMKDGAFVPSPESARTIHASSEEVAEFLAQNADPKLSEVLVFVKSLEQKRAADAQALEAAQAALQAAQRNMERAARGSRI